MQKKEILFIVLLIIVKLIYQYYLFAHGFVSVSADEYARGIRALSLAGDWSGGLAFYTIAWLPLELYINAAILTIWPDPLLAPRFTVFVCSLVLLVFYYKIVRRLFGRPEIAGIAAILVATHPWYIWLSGTPMLDMYFMSFFTVGLYLVFEWRRGGGDKKLWAGLLFFILATGFHSQAWIIVNISNCLLLADTILDKQRRTRTRICKVVVFAILSNSFIFAYLITEYILTGTFFFFFSRHGDGSKWYYGGYNIPLVKKFLHYPKLVVHWFHFMGLFGALSLWPLMKMKARLSRSFLLLLGLASLAAYSTFNLFSVPATAAPGRYMFPFLIFFSPYVALSLWTISESTARRYHKVGKALVLMGLTLPILVLNIAVSQKPTGGLGSDSLQAGRLVRGLIDQGELASDRRILLELTFWDFLAIELISKQHHSVVLDREKNNKQRNLPSDLESLNEAEIHAYLADRRVGLVVIRNREMKKKLSGIRFLVPVGRAGRWRVFRFDPR